jgi:predicted RNA methylase
MPSLPNKIYSDMHNFLNKEGVMKKLKTWLKKSGTELFYYEDIGKQGLDVIDAVHCVHDKKRSIIFLKEIDKIVKNGDTVYEAGIGTGLLSFMASAKGAEVWGTEVSKETYNLAVKAKMELERKNSLKGKINFFLKNALRYKLPKKADVIISENIYTGMFHEKQVQIINRSLRFLKDKGVAIPAKMDSFLYLGECTFPYKVKHKQEVVPSPDRNFKIASKQLSNNLLYDTIDFTKPISSKIHQFSLDIPIIKSGIINGIIIYSEIVMPSGTHVGRFDTSFLNGDIIIAINPPISVAKGELIKLNFRYKYGSNPEKMVLEIKKVY